MDMNFIKKIKKVNTVYWIILGLFLITILSFWYSYSKVTNQFSKLNSELVEQQKQISLLASSLASSTSLFIQSIKNTESTLASALEQETQNLEKKLSSIKNQVGEVSTTVDTLEKLSKTDPELIQKYSKIFFLNEHYVPIRLVDIQNKDKYFEDRDLEIFFEVKPYLENMLSGALKSGIEIYVMSAYRSFDYQEDIKEQYVVVYGDGANQFSANQGYSEHQLGTTIDLITPGIGGTLSGFDNTDAFEWLKNNAFKYGFILSYPLNNSYYIFEPWHWRFVGVELATYLSTSNKNFYNLNQRKLDEYLVNIFD